MRHASPHVDFPFSVVNAWYVENAGSELPLHAAKELFFRVQPEP